MLYIGPAAILAHDRVLEDSAVLVDGERIVAMGPAGEVACPPEARLLRGEGLLVAPGFVDLQFNGAFGSDFTADPSTIWEVGARLPEYGVTAFLPTVVTSPLQTVSAAQEVVCQGPPARYSGAV